VTSEGTYVLNVSVLTDEPAPRITRQLSAPLLKLAADIQASLARLPA
jgi:hypothetical protein